MTLDQRFAAAYLGGLLVGGLCAHAMPWWWAGIPGWAMLVTTVIVSAWQRPVNMEATRCVGFGLFFGAMSGAAAVDFAELADLLTWPGHDSAGAMSAAVGVALAWTFGTVVGDRDARPVNPAVNGWWLYTITVVIGYSPLVAEVTR